MPRDPRYDILFDSVAIGPVVAKNRFYQVPHCNGVGDAAPDVVAGMRVTKAEGGWGVVCTENVMTDAWSDISPFAAPRLWNDDDVAVQRRMVEGVHQYGALAGCELAHFGIAASNRTSRNPPLGPSSRMTMESIDPRHPRATPPPPGCRIATAFTAAKRDTLTRLRWCLSPRARPTMIYTARYATPISALTVLVIVMRRDLLPTRCSQGIAWGAN